MAGEPPLVFHAWPFAPTIPHPGVNWPIAAHAREYVTIRVPLPEWDGELTIVTVDKAHNITIKTGQPKPDLQGDPT